MKKVAVIILNWNGKSFLKKYLPKLIEYTPYDDADLYVADNASTDDSVDFLKQNFPTVKLIEFKKNYGFAEGYNFAISKVDAEYVVLLNSDVEVTPDWLQAPIDYMDNNPRVAACQPKILQINNHNFFEFAGAGGGYIDILGYPFCRGRILSDIEYDDGQYNDVRPVFWASGACLIMRRYDFYEYGGLEASFFAHQEEIDLCWRLNARGRLVMVVPQSVVYHVGGGTLSAENPHKTYLNFRNNLCMLYKNVPMLSLWWVWIIRFFLDYLAAIIMLLQGKKKDAAAAIKGRLAAYSMCCSLKEKRKENMHKYITKRIPVIFKGSILFSYYVLGKNKFSQLLFSKS